MSTKERRLQSVVEAKNAVANLTDMTTDEEDRVTLDGVWGTLDFLDRKWRSDTPRFHKKPSTKDGGEG